LSVLRAFMNQYYDVTLAERVEGVRSQLEHDLASLKQMVLSRFAPEIASLRQEHAQLQADFEGRMEGYSQALKSVWLTMKSELDLSLPNLEAYGVPQPYVSDELGDGLYNSERDYLAQIEAYKQFQGKLDALT
jgi:hypothetical protein